jgi:hypothetical protein
MFSNSNHKRHILEEFEELKNDGFTVKEKIVKDVIYWKDSFY